MKQTLQHLKKIGEGYRPPYPTQNLLMLLKEGQGTLYVWWEEEG